MKPPPYALEMAALGIPTFPCNAEKRPCCKGGFYAATTDTAEMHKLWARSPGPLIGMPTGPASGLDLLDIDPRHDGLDWLAEFAGNLPYTRTIQTRSGGIHFFYNHLPGMRNSESKIAPGVDVRGDGGYAVLWLPSGGALIRNDPLADWPEWLAEIALPKKKESVPFDPGTGEILSATPGPKIVSAARQFRSPAPKTREKRTPEDIALDIISDQIRAVENASPGQLHYTLRGASRTIGGLIEQLRFTSNEAGQMLYRAAQKAGAKDEENAFKTIVSGLELGKAQPLAIGVRA